MAFTCTYVRSAGNTTGFSDAGSGQTRVAAVNHGLANGDMVRISFSTYYNGTYKISNVATNTFDIDREFVADDGAVQWSNTVTTSVTWKLFRVSCPKVNVLCSAQSEAYVAASTVCQQRLF